MSCHVAAAVAPSVIRRTRRVLVGPTTSAEAARAMVNTRPSRSSSRSAANSPRRTAVGRQPHQQQDLLGTVQRPHPCRLWPTTGHRTRPGHLLGCSGDDVTNRVGRGMHPHRPGRWAVHAGQRVERDQSLRERPAKRGPHTAHTARHCRPAGVVGSPTRTCRLQHRRDNLAGPPSPQRISGQESHHRYPTNVDGRQPCSAASQTDNTSASDIPSRTRRRSRSNRACPAHRPSSASATSRSPCTVIERTAERPLTASTPSDTRTSHTPGPRCATTPYHVSS